MKTQLRATRISDILKVLEFHANSMRLESLEHSLSRVVILYYDLFASPSIADKLHLSMRVTDVCNQSHIKSRLEVVAEALIGQTKDLKFLSFEGLLENLLF